MKLLTVLLVALAVPGWGQESNFVTSESKYDARIQEFGSRFKTGKAIERHDLRRLFNRSHANYLRQYSAYAQVGDIFQHGSYDCLSGTYFLAKAVEELGVPFRIVETNYHVFIIATLNDEEILMESTDPVHGFVCGRKNISAKINELVHQQISSDKLYLHDFNLCHDLSLTELSGLFYFNQAIQFYHEGDWLKSAAMLSQARLIYDNVRIKVFAPLLVKAANASQLSESDKERVKVWSGITSSALTASR